MTVISLEPRMELAQWIIERARAAGATASEALVVSGESLGAGVRMGEVEKLKSARERAHRPAAERIKRQVRIPVRVQRAY